MSFFDLFSKKKALEDLQIVQSLSADVDALSIDEAKRQADVLLRDEEKFRLSPLERPLPEWVQGVTRDFFLTYGNVKGRQTETELGLEHMGPSDSYPRLRRIGTDAEGTELLIVPGADTIYWVEGFENEEEVLEDDSCPSIYHHIVMLEAMGNRKTAWD